MKLTNLCRIEWYRFLHSMEIMKYIFVVLVGLLTMSYLNISNQDMAMEGNVIWASIGPAFFYLISFICVINAVYIGREFAKKTICHEFMSGYSFTQIAISKTMTCGVVYALIIGFGICCYFSVVDDNWWSGNTVRLILLFVLLLHICACTVLYVLVFRNGILGGAVALLRLLALETAVQSLFAENARLKFWCITSQWFGIVDTRTEITGFFVAAVVMSAVCEVLLLVTMGNVMRKMS